MPHQLGLVICSREVLKVLGGPGEPPLNRGWWELSPCAFPWLGSVCSCGGRSRPCWAAKGWLCWDGAAIAGLSAAFLPVIPSMSQLQTALRCREETARNVRVPLQHSWLPTRLPLILQRGRLGAPEVPLEGCRMPFVVLIDARAGQVPPCQNESSHSNNCSHVPGCQCPDEWRHLSPRLPLPDPATCRAPAVGPAPGCRQCRGVCASWFVTAAICLPSRPGLGGCGDDSGDTNPHGGRCAPGLGCDGRWVSHVPQCPTSLGWARRVVGVVTSANSY